MFCPNCGKKVSEDAKFCQFCGARIETKETIQTAVSFHLEDKKGEARSQQRRSRKLPLFIATVVILLGTLAGTIKFVILPARQGTAVQWENVYIALSDEGYILASDWEQWEPILLSTDRSEPIIASFDPSGRYLYFFTNQNSSAETATLMRAEYGKLKAGSSRNDRYITHVADNVSIYGVLDESGNYFHFTRDGSVILFEDANRTLCSYDGKKVEEIDYNVGLSWHLSEEDQVMYLVTPPGAQSSTLCLVDPKNPGQRTVLAERVHSVVSHRNLNEIFYTTMDSADDRCDLYLTGINRTPVLLASNMREAKDLIVSNTSNQYFYYAESERSSQLAGDSGFSIYTLNTLQDGTPVCLQDNIWFSFESEGVFFYCVWTTEEQMDAFMSPSELENAGKIRYYAYDIESRRSVPMAQGLISQIEADFGTIEKVTLVGDRLFITCYDFVQRKKSLLAAPMDQEMVDEYLILTNDGQIYCESGGELYYIVNSFERDGDYYVDLYRYGKSGPELLMEDVTAWDTVIYEDGDILVATDRSHVLENVLYNLVIRTREGEQIPVAEDVKRIIRVDEDTMLCISGDDLYCFDGQQRKLIAQNIQEIESKKELAGDSFEMLSFFEHTPN